MEFLNFQWFVGNHLEINHNMEMKFVHWLFHHITHANTQRRLWTIILQGNFKGPYQQPNAIVSIDFIQSTHGGR